MLKTFETHEFFRQRIICATLTGVAIKIEDKTKSSMIQDYEANLLRLMEKITKGTTIQINSAGNCVIYKPGVVVCGPYLQHECSNTRGMGYYLETLLCLAPFAKKPLQIRLKGITNHPLDSSVDTFRNNTITLFKTTFLKGCDSEPSLQVVSRGAYPLGGGEVQFECPILKQSAPPIKILDEGMIKRVRGICYSTRMAPQIANRCINSCRQTLTHFLPDIYIYSDHYSGKQSGNSPGYGIYLQTESDTFCRLAVEVNFIAKSLQSDEQEEETGNITPEDLGKQAAYLLFEQIRRGGCIDETHQWMTVLMMALTSEDVSKVRFGGKLTNYCIQMLRYIQDFLQVTFKLEPEYLENNDTIVLTCVGSGFRNLSRKSS